MLPFINTSSIADMRAAADVVHIKKISENEQKIYLGIKDKSTTDVNEAGWAIILTHEVKTETDINITVKYVNGQMMFNSIWTERENYQYKFKNF